MGKKREKWRMLIASEVIEAEGMISRRDIGGLEEVKGRWQTDK